MKYVACEFELRSSKIAAETAIEILVAELGIVGFESFTETEHGVIAYIQSVDWKKELLDEVQILESDEVDFSSKVNEIEQVNWNEEWEKNFDPLNIDDRVAIRAPFHPEMHLDYEIVIEPKMSFGTGHHETTHMMIQHLLALDLEGKEVLDMGCGTGILAIFAEMRGATKLDAVDIDPWCYENSKENVERNNCHAIAVYEGDVSFLKDQSYDLIIANINRNILLKDMDAYIRCLSPSGVLLLSGFYNEDISVIDEKVSALGLQFAAKKEKNNWVSLKYVN